MVQAIRKSTLSLIERYKEGGGEQLSTVNIGKAIGSKSTDEGTSLTDRYLKNTGRVAQETSRLDPIYGDLQKPDEQTIRNEKLAQAQAQINAINSKYQSIEAADREVIDLMD